MNRSIRVDAVLIQAVIAGALSFSHLHDLASAAGQSGWKAWAYPISVDLLLVAAWRRLRTARRDRAAWAWFVIALFASLGANIATAGLLDLAHVPAWLRIVVAGWPALAFLGGTLLVHTPAAPEQTEDAPAVDMHRTDAAPGLDERPEPPGPAELPAPEPAAEPAPVPASVPPALLDHARKLADNHRATTGTQLPVANLRAQLGLPAPVVDSIAAHLQLT
ncbi:MULTISPECIES: DUF2637 domain-containing protein [unclassified Streptomyces]|uniref:DUF2637 domain-containing protein n=1 Tax=unclassified Streptomyces TaxID=2593676 RepID=UPI00039E888E|nr:DUF2637 domain-containing protein [Streptomyces sp. LaPpAH-202]MYW57546.1 DUF2637 domain-containing protein [Streptomyces sp. SID8370]MYW83773.1 DUF2637 domain-containing protein [Streptomyces sp. SID8371]